MNISPDLTSKLAGVSDSFRTRPLRRRFQFRREGSWFAVAHLPNTSRNVVREWTGKGFLEFSEPFVVKIVIMTSCSLVEPISMVSVVTSITTKWNVIRALTGASLGLCDSSFCLGQRGGGARLSRCRHGLGTLSCLASTTSILASRGAFAYVR